MNIRVSGLLLLVRNCHASAKMATYCSTMEMAQLPLGIVVHAAVITVLSASFVADGLNKH